MTDIEKRPSSLPIQSGSDLSKYTLKTRPWRRHVTPFEQILSQEYKGSGTLGDPFLIRWLDEDAENPQNFSMAFKWLLVAVVSVATLAVAAASSAYSGAVKPIGAEFGVGEEVLILGVSLFVLGFAIGPLLWAPLSEVFGRRNLYIFTYSAFTLWNGVAVASQSMAQLLVFRFLAGAFGSSPLTNAGGTISDVFSANLRGLAMAVFASAPFLGPAIGPICGGFLGEAAGWRWVEAWLALFSGTLTVIGFLIIPETYAPTLLRKRAKLLSNVTGKVYRAPMDAKKELHVGELFKKSLKMPWILLFLEPIVLLLTIYMACIYGTLYMLFSAFPIVFQEGHGWSAGIGGLAFLGVLVGMLSGVAWVIFYDNDRYIRVADRCTSEGHLRAPPEARLPPAILGGVLLVIGLAWFAGSDGPDTFWLVPIMAGAPFGAGMVLVFLALMNYLVDCYVPFYAASALAANSVLRSLFGTIFPLFTTYMFEGVGVHWGAAIPGFLALVCLPFPILFYYHGAPIRKKCKYAREAEQSMLAMLGGSAAAEKKEKQAPAPAAEETGSVHSQADNASDRTLAEQLPDPVPAKKMINPED